MVYNCQVDVWIWRVGTDQTAYFSYGNEAGNSVAAPYYGGSVYMSLPEDADNAVGQTILSWFPD